MKPMLRLLGAPTFLCLFLATAAAQPTDLASSRAVLSQSALRAGENAVIAVVVDIKDGYHAQSFKPSDPNYIAFDVALEPNDRLILGAPIYPAGHDAEYPALGRLNVYDGRVIVYVPLKVKDGAATGPVAIRGRLTYQICDDQVCFPPESPPVSIESEIVAATAEVKAVEPTLFAGFDPSVFATLVDATALPARPRAGAQRIFGVELASNSYWLAFAGALVVGVLFNIVPCVLPVLPLKAIGFYEAAQHSRGKCVALGLAFSAGIVLTFVGLALLVLVFHVVDWGELFSKWWFVGPLTILLLVFAVGQFGFFGVRVPNFLYNVTYKNDTLPGNLVHGVITALLSTPCTFGLFFALLTWAATQPAGVAVALLTVVGAGMAAPYLLLSAFPELARKLPRAGEWSEVVKQMMGFLLLATAAYFAKSFLPDALRGPNFWWVIFALIAAAGLFLVVRAFQISQHGRTIAIACAVALLLVAPAFAVTLKLANPPIQWTYYDDAALERARSAGKPVLVKFTADWCANCQTIELTVFGDEQTVKWLRQHGVTAIKADLTKQTAPGWTLLRKLNPVGAIPVTAVWMPGQTEPRILAGIYSSDELKAALQ